MKILIDTQEITVDDEKMLIINKKLDTASFTKEVIIAVNSTINQYFLAGQNIKDQEEMSKITPRLDLLKTVDDVKLALIDEIIGYVKA